MAAPFKPRSLQGTGTGTGTCPCLEDGGEGGGGVNVQMLSMGGEGAYLDFIANRFRSRASAFQARTGNQVDVIGLGDDLDLLVQEILADVDAKVYDGYVFLPFLTGSVVQKDGLADLTEFVRTNRDINWPDIFPFNREFQSVFDNVVRLLPCDGDVHSLYYRKDLFEQYNQTVPRTWDEYTEVAKFFHGMEVPAASTSANATTGSTSSGNDTTTTSTVTLTGSCVGRKPSCLDFGFFNVLVHSTQTQAGGTRRGSLLDPKIFQPLMGEAMAETLMHLENQIKYGPDDELTYDQCSGLNIERMNTFGNCAMTYHWGDIFSRHMLEDSAIRGGNKLGIAPTPGSRRILDRDTMTMVDCTEEICPFGETYDDIGRVNRAPYAAAGGWSVGVSSGVSPERQVAMADFLGFVCGEEKSLEDVIPNSTIVASADPFRRSQMDIDKWIAQGFPRDTTLQYQQTITQSLSSENTVLDIRFPDADKFLNAMHKSMFVHLNESRTITKTFDDRMKVASDIETAWKKLTIDYDQRDNTFEPLKTSYQKSLSIYTSSEESDDSLSPGAIAGIAVAAAVLAAIITGIISLLTLKRERGKSLMQWEIKKADIRLSSEVLGTGSFGVILKGTIRGSPVAVKPSQHTFSRLDSQTFGAGFNQQSKMAFTESNNIETRTASFDSNSRDASLQSARFSQRRIKEDLSALVKLRSPWVVPCIGAMIDKKVIFVVFEFMENGNLSQALSDAAGVAGAEGNAFELQWALQIAKGLQFLHSQPAPLGPLLHQDIKASNVLLDGSYNAKLSNFALESRVVGSRRDQGSLLWTSPEVLNGEKTSKKSDIYSYGMLIYEIAARARPFRVRRFSRSNLSSYTVSTISSPESEIMPAVVDSGAEYFGEVDGEKLTVPEIITQVSDQTLEPAVRPVLPKQAPVILRDLCVECWSKNPDRRPLIDEITRRLSSSAGPTNLTKNLARRTSLFESILPHHVQEALSRNETVPPQNYEKVTVIFSDIVSFTSTSSKLTAAEVGDLISRLFTKYDWLAEKYGVKKLDVIGDAFLGVTNLPDDTPDHASRAAGFALEAIDAAAKTQICPSKPALGFVDIRFGLATGPVVASVIGSSQYPKFTLFGTTVNTASRMESSSLPGRVQCTKETADLVRELQPLIGVEHRGTMEIKGRGPLETFFLNGPTSGEYKQLRPTGSRKPPARRSMGDIMAGTGLSHLAFLEGTSVEFESGDLGIVGAVRSPKSAEKDALVDVI